MNNFHIPVTQKSLEVDDRFLFMLSEISSFDPGTKVISPSKSATLATS